jgi:hypothetical protein
MGQGLRFQGTAHTSAPPITKHRLLVKGNMPEETKGTGQQIVHRLLHKGSITRLLEYRLPQTDTRYKRLLAKALRI